MQDGDSPIALTGQLQITFDLIDYSFHQVCHLNLLPIHLPLPPCITPLPYLRGVFPEIKRLYIEQ